MSAEKNKATRDSAPSIVLYLLVFVGGMAFSIIGSILPDIAEAFDLTKTKASSLPLLHYVGSFSGLFAIGFFISKPRLLLQISAIVMTVSSLSIGLSKDFLPGVLVTFLCFGASANILVALPGIMVSRTDSGKTARNLNILYGFFSAGVMSAPLFSGALITRGYEYSTAFLILAVLCLALSTVVAITRFPPMRLGESLSARVMKEILLGHGLVFLLVVAMNLCYGAGEGIPNIWIPKYFHDTFTGYSEFRSRFVLSLFWASITAGRYICASILNRTQKPRIILAILSLGAATCLVIAPALRNRFLAEVMFVISGLFFSGMFPILMSFVERFPARFTSTLFILFIASNNIGISGMSKLIGFIADIAGFRFSIMVGAVPLIVVLMLIPPVYHNRPGS